MTAIRNYSTNVPHVFRYPRWAPDVFYPSSSLVSFPFLDSDGTTLRYNYYTSSKDIGPGNGSPYENFDWLLVFDITEAMRVQRNDSDIYRAINNLDSDMAAALEIVRLQSDSDNILSVNEHDSDVAMLYHDYRAEDSDARVNTKQDLDSEILARKSADSDILYLMERIRLQVDSDNIVKISDYDSDRARETHDRKASDSDIKVLSSKNLDSEILARKDYDSDFLVKYDSELGRTYHDFQAADSDINVVIRRLKDQVDSDNIVSKPEHDSDIKMVYHDYRAEDSDLRLEILPTVGAITKDIIGFVDRTSTTLSFTDSDRTLTITPVSSSWTVYDHGTEITVVGPKSIQIANTAGGRYIRFDPTTQQLVDVGLDTYPDLQNHILVAYIYWDSVNSRALIFGEERHSVARDTSWHVSHHLEVGTSWRSGGLPSYTLDDDSDVSIQVSTPLVIADEELIHTIRHSATPTALFEQVLEGNSQIPVLYVLGSRFVEQLSTDFKCPWLHNTTAYYNPITASIGALAGTTSGKFINYWLIATNDTRYPVKLLMGQHEYGTTNEADAEEFEEYDLPLPEMVPMYKITLECRNNYTKNPAKVRISAVKKIESRSSAITNTFSANNHNLLIGKGLEDQHPIVAITGLETRLHNLEAFDSDALNGNGFDYGTYF